MVEVPTWALSAFAIFTSCLLGIIGFLLRSMFNSVEKQGADTRAATDKISAAQEASDRKMTDALARIDKRFVEEQLLQTRAFVDRESWTRDYVTLSQRMDGMHKRIDRVEREARERDRSEGPTQPFGRPGRRRPQSNDTDPPER